MSDVGDAPILEAAYSFSAPGRHPDRNGTGGAGDQVVMAAMADDAAEELVPVLDEVVGVPDFF